MQVSDEGAPDYSGPDGEAATAPQVIGSSIGPYLILGHLGSGGMGDVFVAADERLHREVAIKLLGPRLAVHPQFRNQLLREARAAALLSHPNIAQVYDVLEHDGHAAIVMERLQGTPLSRRLKEGPLGIDEVVDYGQQIAAALTHAHRHRLLHCDLKPANIFVTADGVVKVLDFGLARTVRDASGPIADDVHPPTALLLGRAGTPPYMSPEQLRGEALDERSDIYAFGVVLHEMATGHPPAPAILPLVPSGTTKTGPAQRAVDRRLPRRLRGVIQQATAFDPRDRPPTAADVAAALAPLRTSRAVPRLAALAVVVLLLVLASAALYRRTVRPAASFPERGWALLSDFAAEDAALGRTAREGFTIALRQSRFLNIFDGERLSDALQRMRHPIADPLDQRTAVELGRREGVPLLLAGSVATSGRTTQIAVEGVATATGDVLFIATRAFERADDLFATLDALAVEVRRDLGESAQQIASSSAPLARVTTPSLEALRQYSTAVDTRARARVDDVRVPLESALRIDPDFAMAHLKLGDFLQNVAGDTPLAIEHFKRAYDLRDRVTERERHFIEASYFNAIERYAAARDSMRVLASLYPDDPEIRYELAMAHYSVEDLAAGIRELREAIRLDPRGVRAYGSLALMLARDSQAPAALDVVRQADALGLESPFIHWGAGLARLAQGDVRGALADFEAMKSGGEYYAGLAQLQLARAAAYQGRLDEAADLAAEGTRQARAARDTSMEIHMRLLRARVALAAGHTGVPRAELRAVLADSDEELGAENLRRAGLVALELNDRATVRAVLARLTRLRQANDDAYLEFCVEHLTGEVALRDGKAEAAYRAFEAAALAWPWYESWQGMARALEARGEWRRALQEREKVLTVQGRILRDGFPLDWAVAHLDAARTQRALGDCDGARRSAADAERVLAPGAAGRIGAFADLQSVRACTAVRR